MSHDWLVVSIFATLAGAPAIALLVQAFRKQPPVMVAPPSRWRWLWYVFQAAVALAILVIMISFTPHGAETPGAALLGALALAFYATFAISFYIEAVRRLVRLFRRPAPVATVDGNIEGPPGYSAVRGRDVADKRLRQSARDG